MEANKDEADDVELHHSSKRRRFDAEESSAPDDGPTPSDSEDGAATLGLAATGMAMGAALSAARSAAVMESAYELYRALSNVNSDASERILASAAPELCAYIERRRLTEPTFIDLGAAAHTEIFTFMAGPHDVLNTSSACRRWRPLASDEAVWWTKAEREFGTGSGDADASSRLAYQRKWIDTEVGGGGGVSRL